MGTPASTTQHMLMTSSAVTLVNDLISRCSGSDECALICISHTIKFWLHNSLWVHLTSCKTSGKCWVRNPEYKKICTHRMHWTHLVSPVIAESFRIGPAVTADTHLTSWHTVETTHPQLSSPGTFTFGTEMKEYAGGFSQIATGYKVFGELTLWKRTGSAINLFLQENTSSNPSSSPVSGHFYRAHSLLPDAKNYMCRFYVLGRIEQSLKWLIVNSHFEDIFIKSNKLHTYHRTIT